MRSWPKAVLRPRPASQQLTKPGRLGRTFRLGFRCGRPKEIISKLNAAVVGALADPAVRQRFTDLGEEFFSREQQTPEALGALQKADIEKWWPIVKAANIKGE
jgi:tripartite-type tricarboxylate transporter receptor subunit TctC